MQNIRTVQKVKRAESVVQDYLQVVDFEADFFGALHGLTQGLFDHFHDQKHVFDRFILMNIERRGKHVVNLCGEDILLDRTEFPQELHLAKGLLGFILVFKQVSHKFDSNNLAGFIMDGFHYFAVRAGANMLQELVVG